MDWGEMGGKEVKPFEGVSHVLYWDWGIGMR